MLLLGAGSYGRAVPAPWNQAVGPGHEPGQPWISRLRLGKFGVYALESIDGRRRSRLAVGMTVSAWTLLDKS